MTFGNVYCPSGTDGVTRTNRETFCAETIPNLFVNSKSAGCLGGDFNMIIDKRDAIKNPASKMSPTFKRLVKTFNLNDSFRCLHPQSNQFSRYYSNIRGDGASRIDRSYHYGDIRIQSACYLPLAFSDHHSHVVKMILPDPFTRLLCPPSYPSFRIKAEVVKDDIFNWLKQCKVGNQSDHLAWIF